LPYDIIFSSNLLHNFDGMDMFVVVVSVVAIVFMLSAACWVRELAPDLSGKLGVSQQLLVRTVLSKLARTLSPFSRDRSCCQRAAARRR
jgi:hypothetical protein